MGHMQSKLRTPMLDGNTNVRRTQTCLTPVQFYNNNNKFITHSLVRACFLLEYKLTNNVIVVTDRAVERLYYIPLRRNNIPELPPPALRPTCDHRFSYRARPVTIFVFFEIRPTHYAGNERIFPRGNYRGGCS